MEFDYMNRGTLVGEPTGGSTGQPLSFNLPGGGSARVCAKRDTYPDGKRFAGVGIMPDVLAPARVSDFASGEDSVLKAALLRLKEEMEFSGAK
jgi:carboxyl-terminal processing protease